MSLATYRIGAEDANGRAPEGALRLATVRFLPRGMSEAERKRRDLYDVWLPQFAPSAELLAWARGQGFPEADAPKAWARFAQRYAKEMTATAERREALKFLALLARGTDIALGCYCASEARCHRSVLKELVAGAE